MKWHELTPKQRIEITRKRLRKALRNYDIYYNGTDYKVVRK